MKKATLTISVIMAIIVLGGCAYAASSSLEPHKPAVVYTSQQLLDRVNSERAKQGVKPLQLDDSLNLSAQEKAHDMLSYNYYEHINPTSKENGYEIVFKKKPECRFASENLNEVPLGEDPMIGWKKSKAHYDALVDERYDSTGFAYVSFSGKGYYVEHFCDLD